MGNIAYELNGHELEIQVWYDFGAVEDLAVWCHTCDPPGRKVAIFNMREYPELGDAIKAALDYFFRHAG